MWHISRVLHYQPHLIVSRYSVIKTTWLLLQVRFLEGRGVQESRAARLYIYSGLTSLLIRPMIGRLNDVTWINMFYIYSIATGVECVVTFLLPFSITNLSLVIYFVVFGLADGAMGCGLPIAVINSLPEKMRPLGIGAFNCLSCFASACGPALGGKVQFCLLFKCTVAGNPLNIRRRKILIGKIDNWKSFHSLDKFLIFIDYIFLRSCRRYRKIVCPYVQHGWCFDNRWYCDADCSFLHEEIWVAEPYFRKRNCVVGVGSSRCCREVLCCLNVVFLVFHFTDCGNKVRTK